MIGTPAEAIRAAHLWFETNSGWAPPDADTLTEWLADGVCRCPDECLVGPRAWCEHGLASWWLILDALGEAPIAPAEPVPPEPADDAVAVPHVSRLDPSRPDFAAILEAHNEAMRAGNAGYIDPTTGLFVMTAGYLVERNYCCDQGCRHCPYVI